MTLLVERNKKESFEVSFVLFHCCSLPFFSKKERKGENNTKSLVKVTYWGERKKKEEERKGKRR